MKCVVATIALIVGCVGAQADVYKWTDEKGEVHYGEFSAKPNPKAQDVMSDQQIHQEEADEKSAAASAKPPPSSPDYLKESYDIEQQRDAECQRYENLRNDKLLNSGSSMFGYNAMGYGYGYGYGYAAQNNNNLSGMTEIMAGIKKYCQ